MRILMTVSSSSLMDGINRHVLAIASALNALQGVCFRDYKISEDILFQTEALVRARKVIVTSEMLYGYRECQGSAINSALSERKVMDRVGYLTTVIKLLLQSGKRIPPSLMRICVNGVTEGFANEYFCLDRNARKRVRTTWLRNARGLSGIGVFQSVRLTFLRWLPFSFGMRVLCLSPYRLKSRGLRRGSIS